MEGNKEPFKTIPAGEMMAALRHITDTRKHPIYLHCNKGTPETAELRPRNKNTIFRPRSLLEHPRRLTPVTAYVLQRDVQSRDRIKSAASENLITSDGIIGFF
jgi:hypothetical protein